MDKIKDQAACSKLIRDEISFSILSAMFLFHMKLAIQRREVDIFLELISKKSLVLNKNIEGMSYTRSTYLEDTFLW